MVDTSIAFFELINSSSFNIDNFHIPSNRKDKIENLLKLELGHEKHMIYTYLKMWKKQHYQKDDSMLLQLQEHNSNQIKRYSIGTQ